MNKAMDRIKQAWNENPIGCIIVASLAATAAAKLMDASTNRVNAHAWSKEVDRRSRIAR